VTINFHSCRILLALTPEQFERFLEATRDGAAIETTGESVPPTEPPPAAAAAATPSNVVPFRQVAA
jgi:hypothetical protein